MFCMERKLSHCGRSSKNLTETIQVRNGVFSFSQGKFFESPSPVLSWLPTKTNQQGKQPTLPPPLCQLQSTTSKKRCDLLKRKTFFYLDRHCYPITTPTYLQTTLQQYLLPVQSWLLITFLLCLFHTCQKYAHQENEMNQLCTMKCNANCDTGSGWLRFTI